MDDLYNLEIRKDLLQQSPSYTVYLPLLSSGIIIFYIGVYILRYYCWRIKQRRRKIRLLEYEKLRWVWHQKQIQPHYQTKEEQRNIDIDGEHDAVGVEKYPFSRSSSSSSSSLSVTTINDNKNENENEPKIKAKRSQHQQPQNKCDYGDDSSHCREPSLMVTIPSPAYQPSNDHHSHSTTKPRLPNQKTTTELHHHHYHQHLHQNSSSSSSSSSASSSSIREASPQGHQGSFYSSSSSTTTLACSCLQQHRCKKENNNNNNPGTPPCLTSSPTTLSFSNPTSPFSSLKETPHLFYPNKEEKETHPSHQDSRSQARAFVSNYDKKNASNTLTMTPSPITTTSSQVSSRTTKSSPPSSSSHTYWAFYDTKAKRTRMIWKWSVAMGYCHYDHAKVITSIIDQLDPPPSHGL